MPNSSWGTNPQRPQPWLHGQPDPPPARPSRLWIVGCAAAAFVVLGGATCGGLVCLGRSRRSAAGTSASPPAAQAPTSAQPPAAATPTSIGESGGCRSGSFLGDKYFNCDVKFDEILRLREIGMITSNEDHRCRFGHGMKVDATLTVTEGAARIAIEAVNKPMQYTWMEARPGAPARLSGITRCNRHGGYLGVEPLGGVARGVQLTARLDRL
jgi:hypothetical protein